MKKRNAHEIEDLGGGRTRIRLRRNGPQIIPGTSSDPWAVSEFMAASRIIEEMEREAKRDEMIVEQAETSNEVRESDEYKSAKRRETERHSEVHTSSAFERVTERIKSFGQTLADLASGVIDRREV